MAYVDSSTLNPRGQLASVSRFSTEALPDPQNPEALENEETVGDPDKQEDPRQFLLDQIDETNIAESLDQAELDKIGMQVTREYQIDEESRADWLDQTQRAIDFANQKTTPKTFPWPGASNLIFPLVTTATVQFQARTYPAMIQNRNVVKGTVWGSDDGTPATDNGKPDGQPKVGPDGQPIWLSAPGEKRVRADKIGEHMSFQLLDENEMAEWEPQFDSMLMQLPIVGGAAKKTYFDPIERRNYSLLVPLMKLVWNKHAKSFESAPRHTEIQEYYPLEILENENAELWLHLDYGPADASETEGAAAGDDDAPHVFLEQHRRLDLDGDGYPEPYIVTVHKRSSKVVRIVARYDEDGIITSEDGDIVKISPVEYYTLVPFMPDMEGGSYPLGFGHLLRPINEGINTTINQMFDAGTLQNAGGGFVGTSLSMHSGPVTFQVGKYVPVNNKGMAIKDAVLPLPMPGPSAVLFQLLGLLIGSGKELASTQDILTGDASMANAPPTTVLALIEQGTKVYTAIYKRVYRAMKSEFAKIYRLNRKYLTQSARYRIGDEWREITPDDYRLGGGVEPIADPTMVTDMQKMGRASVLMTLKDDPLINQIEIRKRFLDACQIERVDSLVLPPPQGPSPAEQLKMQMDVAELGRTRAAEAKDQTQAYLNLALARAKANGPELDWIDKQLELLRLHVEAANTTIKAASIDHKFHDTHVKHLANEARNAANATSQSVSGNEGAGVSAMAALPSDGGISPNVAGPSQGLPGQDNGGLA